MKELISALLFGTSESTVVRECRRCGTGVSATATSCPQCGVDDIIEYTLE